MWFVWGAKNTRSRVGVVADYCPICHQSRAFVLAQLGQATHVYGVAVGQDAVTGHLITCESCGVELDGDPSRYTGVARRAPADLRALAAATHPDLPRLEESERERMRRLRCGETQDRVDAVVRPLYLVAVAFERRKIAMRLGVVGWLVMFTACLLTSIWVGQAMDSLIPALVMSLLFLTLVVDRVTDSGRYLKRVTYPALKRALGPLRPSADELATAQARLVPLKLRLAKRLAPADVHRVLVG